MGVGTGPLRPGLTLLRALLLFALSGCASLLGPEGTEPGLPPSASPPYDMHIEGEPASTLVMATGGFFIWKIIDRWHIRVAGTGLPSSAYPREVFAGAVFVENGFLRTTKQQTLRPPDELRLAGNNLSFRFEVGGKTEPKEFQFVVQAPFREYCVVFDLSVNGLSDPRTVHLGRALFTPGILPLRVCVRQ